MITYSSYNKKTINYDRVNNNKLLSWYVFKSDPSFHKGKLVEAIQSIPYSYLNSSKWEWMLSWLSGNAYNVSAKNGKECIIYYITYVKFQLPSV